jgi:hypothetical protein
MAITTNNSINVNACFTGGFYWRQCGKTADESKPIVMSFMRADSFPKKISRKFPATRQCRPRAHPQPRTHGEKLSRMRFGVNGAESRLYFDLPMERGL